MGRQFAIVAAVIALLTAGALLIVRRVTEPLPQARTPSRGLAADEPAAGQPARLPFAPPPPGALGGPGASGGPDAPGGPGTFGAPVTVSDADAEAEAAGRASPAPPPPPPAEEAEEEQTAPARPNRLLNRPVRQLQGGRVNSGEPEQ